MDKIFFAALAVLFFSKILESTYLFTKKGRYKLIKIKEDEINTLYSMGDWLTHVLSFVYIFFYLSGIAYCLKEITG